MSTPNFCSWERTLAQVGALLHVAPADMPSEWTNIASHAARRAAAELRSILTLKGYTPDQIAAWSDCETYSLQLATYFAITSGAALANYDIRTIEWMDVRKEMREAQAIIIDGVAVAVALNSDVGGVQAGQITAARNGLDPCNRGSWGAGTDWVW